MNECTAIFFKENVINTDSECFRIKLLTLENIVDRNRIKKKHLQMINNI